MHTAYLIVGSNIEPEENIRQALALLRKQAQVEKLSSIWETQAEGTAGPNFLNLAVFIQCEQDVETLKWQVLRGIESQLGRVRTSDKNAPRTMDLDIEIYDDRIVDEKLWERFFVIVPMADLLPELKNPETGKTLRAIAAERSREGLARLKENIRL